MTSFESRPPDKFAILKRVPVFASCTEEQLRLIADRTRLMEYKKGECVYREGDKANAFYIVSSGRLRIFSQVNGREEVFAVLHNGDSFGEISLLTGELHSATVQALNDTLILELEKTDFDEVINRIPSLVLYLSRVLSKRLRTKEHGGGFIEATIIGIFGALSGSGRTCFAMALASALKEETGHEAVVVDFGGAISLQPSGGVIVPRLGGEERVSEEMFEQLLSVHPLGFSVLFARPLLAQGDGETAIAPLLSLLTNRFRYILMDLPIEVTPVILKALGQSDLMYLMINPQQEQIIHTNALMHRLQAVLGNLDQRVRIVLNRLEGSEPSMSLEEVAQQLNRAPDFTLPFVPPDVGPLIPEGLQRFLASRTSPYTLTVRRMARELGGLLVGLALGSGAALGLAHIGILKVIERERIPIDLVAGSSIGALIGGLWASGHSAEELERMALRFKNPWDIRKLFIFDLGMPVISLLVGIVAGTLLGWLAGFWTGFLFGVIVCVAFGVVFGPLVGGPIQGAKLMAQLEEDFGGKTFQDTWVPLKIVAANPMAREEVIFDSGSIAEAVRASVSIPGIFKPVIRKGKVCLDGGVVNPIPVSVLKRSGANRVIAVNVFPTTEQLVAHRQQLQRARAERDASLASRNFVIRVLFRIRQELVRSMSPLIFDVIMRSMQSMEYQIAEVSCRDADLTLRPAVPGSHWLEFFHPEKFINKGEEIALQCLPELKRIARVRSVDKPDPAQ